MRRLYKSLLIGLVSVLCEANAQEGLEAALPVAEELAASPTIQTLIITKSGLAELGTQENGVFSDVLTQSMVDEVGKTFLGQVISEDVLKEFRTTVLKKLREEGDFSVVANYPEQDVSSGVVVLKIEQPNIELVEVKGNKWESSEFYENKLLVAAGDPLNTDQLLNQIAWFNRNPFHYVEAVIGPGTQSNSVDVDLVVNDRFSLRPFAGSDNTGTNSTDEVRIFAGANWGKPFGRSDLMTYQYTCAPNPSTFYAHTGSYLIFLPWKDELSFYGGYSQSKPDVPGFFQQGRSAQVSMRYAMPTKPFYESLKRTFTFGLDYKNINSNVFFVETDEPVISHQVNITQFYLSYQWERKFMIKGEVIASPVQWLHNQTNSGYEQLRPGASVRYIYGRLAMSDTYFMPYKCSFAWTLRGQVASGPLLPSEQYALGGYDTVRGYEERDYLADDAVCINAEFRSPKVSFFKKDELVFLGFSDFGGGHNYQSALTSQASQFLWSAGLGTRYRIGSYFSIRADYGFQLHHILSQHAFGRFHLGGYLSY